MAKNSMNLKGVTVKLEDGKFIAYEKTDNKDIQEKYDITEMLNKLVGLESNVKIGKARKVTEKEKKPSYKYVCPNCGAKARSNEELDLICGKCKQEYEIAD